MTARTVIQVPASTSNLGAGFDCIGVALDVWLRLDAALDPSADGFAITRAGTLAALELPAEEDRLVCGFRAACAAAGAAVPHGVSLHADSAIPVARGLGSSAAATVAGALAANQLLELGLGEADLVRLCAEVEGHADNVAPALVGGATLVTRAGKDWLVTPLEIHPDIAFVFVVPGFAVETRRARAVLPEFVPHRIAAGAAARAATLVRGLADAGPALLALGLDDVLHVPFRKRLIPGYVAVTAAARAAGAFGATLSGSGSAILALAPHAAALAVGEAAAAAWHSLGIHADVLHPTIVKEVVCR